jgi:hypothetical protein
MISLTCDNYKVVSSAYCLLSGRVDNSSFFVHSIMFPFGLFEVRVCTLNNVRFAYITTSCAVLVVQRVLIRLM